MKLLQSPSQLAQQLRENQISERDHYNFLLGFLVLYGLIAQPSLIVFFINFRAQPLHELLNLIAFIITVWELNACFYINQRGDRQNFLSRYTCLGFAITIRYYTAYILIYWLIYWIAGSPAILSAYLISTLHPFLVLITGLLAPLFSYLICLKMQFFFILVAGET